MSTAVGGVRVVEPFMVESILGQNITAPHWREEVRFSDVFDIDEFQRFAEQKKYNVLVPYHQFLEDAPQKLLIAQYRTKENSCGHEEFIEDVLKFAKLNGFEMVGNVCLEYSPDGVMNLEFTSQLYSKYHKSEVVVIFPLFGGVMSGKSGKTREGYRLFLSLSQCNRGMMRSAAHTMKLSKLAKDTAENYIQKYLKGNSYITVMMRLERVIPHNQETASVAEKCLNYLHSEVEKIKSRFDIQTITVSFDIGMYGSVYPRQNQDMTEAIVPHLNNFLSQTVREGMTLSEWDSRFTNSSPIRNPGFVAAVQKSIAARGDVLVLFGKGSAYHQTTITMFLTSHSKQRLVKLGACGKTL